MNQLHLETSPYLLQHAGNPIYWKAWSENTLAEAKIANKLMVLSVGYSACHWCHVMEHESFEDENVAKVMNKNYISIKVDREERPDVDATYMKAVQLMTNQGGWPMNVVLLPDGRPVWGGTYFRKNDWINALTQLQELFETDPAKMEEYAAKLHEGLQAISLPLTVEHDALPGADAMQPILQKWMKSFDWEFGGYARAPKFMMPCNYIFLQHYGYRYNVPQLLEFVDLTLTRMAHGGLFDVLGGGFSRYSVDVKWHVPHFEKMLYDNGQLMSLYAQAYRRTKNPLYKEVIEKTHAYTLREQTLPNGAFYSALDADSLDVAGHLEEGAFYVWEKQELKELLGDDFDAFAKVFSINEFGFWEDGKFVLIQREPLEELAGMTGLTLTELKAKKQQWEKLLFAEREKRPRPRLDDKTLTSWNALMLKGYADAYKALGNDAYITAAEKNARFILDTIWQEDGSLLRTYKDGVAKISGFLEDYAHTADALITLYEATLNEEWLSSAKKLTDYALEHFYDGRQPFLSYTQLDGEQLVAPHYETEDNVIPASNSVMAIVLKKLGTIYGNTHYEELARTMLLHIIPGLDYPSAFANWMELWLSFLPGSKELAIVGEGAQDAAKEVNRHSLPNVAVAGSAGESAIPFLQGRFAKDSLMFYVCENKACNLPVSSIDEALVILHNY
ncbi:MAG: thioredoxin domain-containing protein [Flavobacterium sp.]